MENYSYASYPDSGNSSPRSREIDCENPPWDEPSSNYKVKFMCSYGGKIHPRPHDNQLAYVAGDTKILTVDRNIRYSGFISRLTSLCDAEVCFKYQLPGEDLDALISVTNDEDLEHMMIEYDRVHRASPKPARLRLFLFPVNPPAATSFESDEPKNERWFMDTLNSVPIQNLDASSSPADAAAGKNPDFLFGFDKRIAPPPTVKLQDPTPEPAVHNVTPANVVTGSDSGRYDPNVGGEQVGNAVEIQRQIEELQRLQIANHEQAMLRKSDENLARLYPGDYYMQKAPDKSPSPSPSPVSASVSVPATYWQERHLTNGVYPANPTVATGTEQPVYYIQAPGAMYQQQQQPQPQPQPPVRQPVPGQGYYAMQRVVQDVYREQQMYNMVPPPAPASAPQSAPAPIPSPQQGGGIGRPVTGGGVGLPETGYTQVAYDSAGRQVFYTTSPGGVNVMPNYQAAAAAGVDVRQQAAVQEGNRAVGR